MQLTFILGNGFDKAIGLKTGYYDFYKSYLNPNNNSNESTEVELLKNTIQKELENNTGKWEDFEYALGQFTAILTDKHKFISCFQSARQSLIEYIKMDYADKKAENKDFLKSAAHCLVTFSNNSDNDLSEDNKEKYEIPQEVDIVFNCISFNYTPVLTEGKEELISSANSISRSDRRPSRYQIGDVINVHGTLNDFPIFGVDNVLQIANESFRDDPEIVRMMVKGEIDKKLGSDWRDKALEIIDKSDNIYVYGASLGETDEFWWKALAKWFESDEKHELALYCHPDMSPEEMRKKKKAFIDSISKHFTRKDLRAEIAIDCVTKNMKVKFIRMSGNAESKTYAIGHLSLVKAQQLDDNKEIHP